MGGVLDELRALKNSGLVSTKLPAPKDGGEKPVVIDVAEEFVEPAATVEPEDDPPVPEPESSPPSDEEVNDE